MSWYSQLTEVSERADERLGILISVLIVMDYFFRCHKSASNLEKNKCIFQGNFFIYTLLDPLTPELFLELRNRYIQNFERNWKKSFFIRANNFAKSVRF